jgi:hypothetical protein
MAHKLHKLIHFNSLSLSLPLFLPPFPSSPPSHSLTFISSSLSSRDVENKGTDLYEHIGIFNLGG